MTPSSSEQLVDGLHLKTAGDLAYYVGVDLVKSASDAKPVYHLAGRLYLSASGWLLLSVPNALLHGVFDALDEPGVEKPYKGDGSLNAHISVMRREEVEQIGPDNIHERGHTFRYTLGPLKTVEPKTWDGVSKVWYVTVYSPELRKLRKSYGLSGQPNDDWDFHITVAVRKTGVLHENETSKLPKAAHHHTRNVCPECGNVETCRCMAPKTTTHELCYDCKEKTAELLTVDELKKKGQEVVDKAIAGEYCPFCEARLEYDPDSGTCNRCGKAYAVKQSSLLELWSEMANA